MIASKDDWGPLYNSTALGKNQVPVASATYFEVIGPVGMIDAVDALCLTSVRHVDAVMPYVAHQ